MKLYERFGDKGFHTSVVTTFGIDFETYENVVLPRLRGAGSNNNLLVTDGSMLSYALDGEMPLPQLAGRHYTVTAATAKGVFHPKIVLQLGRNMGRMIIGSANMTGPGIAGNLELAGVVDCLPNDSAERRLVAAAWRYVDRHLDVTQQAIAYQRNWMRVRTPWLFDTEPAEGPITLSDGSTAAFLAAGGERGIGARFASLVEERPVLKLIVLSPYWDDNIDGLKHLVTALKPKELVILIDREKGLFPGDALRGLPEAKIFDLGGFDEGRFIHAKLFVAQTKKADHVLYGSANCTIAALGGGNFLGTNEEACLYRRLPVGTVMKLLELDGILTSQEPLDVTTLPPLAPDEPVPLAEAALRAPGRFEYSQALLIWWPPAASKTEAAQIELLDAEGGPLPVSMTPLAATPEHKRFRLTGSDLRLSFARLRFPDGAVSAPAIVSVVDALYEIVREPRGRRAEEAALRLASETEEGLWLLDILDSLEAAEAAQNEATKPRSRRTREKSGESADEGDYKTLDYERFMAGRHLRSDGTGAGRNGLAGSELSLVRDFLNRILAIGEALPETVPPPEQAAAAGLDMGDETAHGASAIEGGMEFGGAAFVPEQAQREEKATKRAQGAAAAEDIAWAAENFTERTATKASEGSVGKFDILRLRAILTILLAAGQPPATASNDGAALTSLQVLPLDDSDNGWPRLVGRVLFAFFGGTRPAICVFRIEATDDRLPEDIVECWATCIWAAQAVSRAVQAHRVLRDSLGRISASLIASVYRLTRLRPEELTGPLMSRVMSALDERFANRLGLVPGSIAQTKQ